MVSEPKGGPTGPEAILAGYRVHGRVQGVGFRWWTRQTACALRLGGHVRNRSDGSVEVVAVGSVDQLERIRDALAKGPPGCRVARVECFEPTDWPVRDAFEIVR